MSAAPDVNSMAQKVMLDAQFQAACQRYAHSGGSSQAIAFHAARVLRETQTDMQVSA